MSNPFFVTVQDRENNTHTINVINIAFISHSDNGIGTVSFINGKEITLTTRVLEFLQKQIKRFVQIP